ncbi:MAG TPA: cupin domain-containing protein [Gaiellaceae bacterium]
MSDRLFNLRGLELPERDDPGHAFRRRFLGEAVGAERTGFAVYELAPGQTAWPYHYELSEEEWLFVVDGELVLRAPGGETTLRPGDVVCFPVGPDGAHQMRNDSAAPVRFAMPSAGTEGRAYVAIRPDSNTAMIEGPGFSQVVPLDVALEYWEREP